MKIVKVLLAIIVTVSMTDSSFSADWNFTVTTDSTWHGFINVYDQAMNHQFGFDEGTLSDGELSDGELYRSSGSFAAGPALPLILGPNTRIYDDNIMDPFWVDQTTYEATLITEFNLYQEVNGAVGQTVRFNFKTVANSLPAGYSAIGFIKVLDGYSTWQTSQFEQIPLVADSSDSLNLTVASPGTGLPVIQAGFAITGAYVSGGNNALGIPANPIASTNVQVIPEPSSAILIACISGLGLFVRRRLII